MEWVGQDACISLKIYYKNNGTRENFLLQLMLKVDSKRAGCHVPSSIFYMEDIFHHHIKVFLNQQHKLGGWGAFPTFYSTDGFGTVSGSFSKFILVDATLFSDFSDIIGNRHKNPFFQFYIFLLSLCKIMCPIKRTCAYYLQCPVIAEASDFPRTFPNMSKRSFSPTLIGAYFSLSEIRKIPSLSFCNFLM